MERNPAKIQQRIRVGGIKLSPELVQFVYTRTAREECSLTSMLKAIASRQINITYLTFSAIPDGTAASFCVESQMLITAKALAESAVLNSSQIRTLPSVGSITIFPHRNSLSLLGGILRVFSSAGIPVHGLCTSISAMTVITDYSKLDNAVQAVEGIIELPENHSPLRQQVSIRQVGP